MFINFLIIISLYFLVIFSVIGYGHIFCNVIFGRKNNLNFGYKGLFGILVLIFYSYLSHFFYSHNLIHNSFLIILGLFFYFIYKKKDLNEIFFILSIFLVLFISLIIFKTHDDFPYYHFSYSFYLTQNPMWIGIGQFNHGFRTPSSIFYLNSLFYLPIIKFYFFHLAAILILGFTNIIFIKGIIQKIQSRNYDFICYFLLLSILFINIFFYRISEHGTDRSAQILVFLLVFEILRFFVVELNNKIQLSKIFLVISIIISFKAFYILYLMMLIPVLLVLKKNNDWNKVFYLLVTNTSSYVLVSIFLIILIINFFNTSCLIYPISFTCFEGLDWSIASIEVEKMNNWYEQWSKAGAGPNFRVNDPEKYILGFNWVDNWIDKYFFNKVSDFLLGIVFLTIIVTIIFFSKNKKKFFINKNIYFLFIIILLLLFEWFYNHPSLRYGGYVLIATILFLPLSLYLSYFSLNFKRINRSFTILIIFSFIVFFGRNISRIENEITKYSYRPFVDNSFRISDNHYKLQKNMNYLIDNYERCNKEKKNCNKKLAIIVDKGLYTYIFKNK